MVAAPVSDRSPTPPPSDRYTRSRSVGPHRRTFSFDSKQTGSKFALMRFSNRAGPGREGGSRSPYVVGATHFPWVGAAIETQLATIPALTDCLPRNCPRGLLARSQPGDPDQGEEYSSPHRHYGSVPECLCALPASSKPCLPIVS